MAVLPHNAVLLAFEGPDPYAMVGGLGTRVSELSAALAHAGVHTTLVFVGDPDRAPVERPASNLEYRRWCQWISSYHRDGVYDGEAGKINDFAVSVPPFVADTIVKPAFDRGESVLVIAEDWQTVPAALTLHAMLRERGLRRSVILQWNANNTYGFHTIDWPALSRATQITTVSRYMKFELKRYGVDASVIPNGIPERLLGGVPKKLRQHAAKRVRHRRPFFVKIGRFDEDKGWMQAIEAFAMVRARHPSATLVIRGGRETHARVVFERARQLALAVNDVTLPSREVGDAVEEVGRADGPIVNVCSFLPEEALLALYHAADAVIANSRFEPFGLVGLEVMAVEGVAITGSTGEDYAHPYQNAFCCDTGDPRELATYLELACDRDLGRAIRAHGRATAALYAWPHVLQILAGKASESL